jgi:hypothetical protein
MIGPILYFTIYTLYLCAAILITVGFEVYPTNILGLLVAMIGCILFTVNLLIHLLVKGYYTEIVSIRHEYTRNISFATSSERTAVGALTTPSSN